MLRIINILRFTFLTMIGRDGMFYGQSYLSHVVCRSPLLKFESYLWLQSWDLLVFLSVTRQTDSGTDSGSSGQRPQVWLGVITTFVVTKKAPFSGEEVTITINTLNNTGDKVGRSYSNDGERKKH